MVTGSLLCASCGCSRGDPTYVTYTRLQTAVENLDNLREKPVSTPRTQLPARAYGISVFFKDSLVKQEGSNVECVRIEYLETIQNVRLYSLRPGNPEVKSENLIDRFKVYVNNSNAISVANLKGSGGSFQLLLYGLLPAYGPQRFVVETELSDGRTLRDTTTRIDLLP